MKAEELLIVGKGEESKGEEVDSRGSYTCFCGKKALEDGEKFEQVKRRANALKKARIYNI